MNRIIGYEELERRLETTREIIAEGKAPNKTAWKHVLNELECVLESHMACQEVNEKRRIAHASVVEIIKDVRKAVEPKSNRNA